MKKIIVMLACLLSTYSMAQTPKTIVSVQIRQDTNDHLGMIDAISADPLTKDTIVKVVIAEPNATPERIAAIRKEIKDHKPYALFLSNTGAAIAAIGTLDKPDEELRKLPIVISSVTNPLVSKVADTSTKNVVGTIHVGKPSLVLNQLQRSLEKRISSAAILITEDEIPARAWGEELNNSAQDFKVQSKIIYVSKKENGIEEAVAAATGSDIIIIGPDTYLGSNNPVKLSKLALENKIPVMSVTFNPIQVKGSEVLFSLSANGKSVGLDAGEKLKKILIGEKIENLSIEPIKQITLFYRETPYNNFNLKLKSTALENAQKIID